MKVVGFLTEENDKLYDFNSIKNILKVSKTKLYRDLKKIETSEFIRYKNQYLYKEKTLLLLMEKTLIDRLDKIEKEENEFRESQNHRRKNYKE
jgi:hypothetical protein